MKRALIVGLNYEGGDYALPDCDKDAYSVELRAIKAGYRTQTQTGVFSADDFLAELVRLREASTKTSTTLIAYSGHGSRRYVSGSGEADREEEYLCLWNGNDIEVFHDDAFRKLLLEIKGTVIVYLDCCFSGGMSKSPTNPRNPEWKKRFVPFDEDWKVLSPEPSLKRAASAAGNKIYFLFAAQENEVSWSTGNGGLFTNAFCGFYDRFVFQRTVKNMVSAAAKICIPDQRPFYQCLNGTASKKVF